MKDKDLKPGKEVYAIIKHIFGGRVSINDMEVAASRIIDVFDKWSTRTEPETPRDKAMLQEICEEIEKVKTYGDLDEALLPGIAVVEEIVKLKGYDYIKDILSDSIPENWKPAADELAIAMIRTGKKYRNNKDYTKAYYFGTEYMQFYVYDYESKPYKYNMTKNDWIYANGVNIWTEYPEKPEQEEKSCGNNCTDLDVEDIFRKAKWDACPDCGRKIPQDKPKEWERQKEFDLDLGHEGNYIVKINREHFKRILKKIENNAEGIQLCMDDIKELFREQEAGIIIRDEWILRINKKIAELEKQIKGVNNE